MADLVKLNVMIPRDLREAFQEACLKSDVSQAQGTREALRQWIRARSSGPSTLLLPTPDSGEQNDFSSAISTAARVVTNIASGLTELAALGKKGG